MDSSRVGTLHEHPESLALREQFDTPWQATGLEWKTPSPPPTFNFDETPVVTWEAYEYDNMPLPEEVTLER